MIHKALMRPSPTAFAEEVDRFQSRLFGYAAPPPIPAHERAMLRVLEVHMRREHIGHAARFAAAHGIGLARHRKRTHAGLPDPAGGEMTIDDGVDLVSTGRRLIHALAVNSDGTLVTQEEIVKCKELFGPKACVPRGILDCIYLGSPPRSPQIQERMPLNISGIDAAVRRKMGQEAH